MFASENLSALPAEAWIGEALAAIAVARTEGDPGIRTTNTPTVREAQLLHAEKVITGYYSVRDDIVTVQGGVRDETARRVIKTFEISAPSKNVPLLAATIAKETGAPVHDWYNADPRSLRPYFAARLATAPAEAIALLDQAIAADPTLSAAQVMRADLLARTGEREKALAAIAVLQQGHLVDSDAARVDLLTARVRDDMAAQVLALTRLARIDSPNPQLWRAVADGALVTKDYGRVAEAARHVLELEPFDEPMLNLRGYALGFAGDLPAARTAFAVYRATYPAGANATDSLGEMLFYYRQYDEASKLFLEAGAKDPLLLNGAEPFRAALCRFLLKDVTGADALFSQYANARRKARDALLPLRQAIWMRMTRRAPQGTNDATGLAMSAFWALLDGERARALSLAESARRAATTPGELSLASTALVVSQPTASPELWKARIDQLIKGPGQENFRADLLGWSLLLDGHHADAAKVWKAAWDKSSALTGEQRRVLLTWSLLESGRTAEARKLMPQGWLPPAGPDPGLNLLTYPRMVDLRAKIE